MKMTAAYASVTAGRHARTAAGRPLKRSSSPVVPMRVVPMSTPMYSLPMP